MIEMEISSVQSKTDQLAKKISKLGNTDLEIFDFLLNRITELELRIKKLEDEKIKELENKI